MISWGDAHARAAVAASELHADLDTDLTRPVDVFEAVKRLGLVLAFAPLGKVSGLYLHRDPTPGILLHQGHPRTRQRYTAGHELGHHVFNHAAEIDFDLELALHRANGGIAGLTMRRRPRRSALGF
ncbi:MAG TPA: ImmA/IrrE family metallo-endopeptidase [Solirubrobacteraceae bacterium]|nr:ImmA/IrrE family metallo-endopeptidase [Solirubrobacteraceae bacterium]